VVYFRSTLTNSFFIAKTQRTQRGCVFALAVRGSQRKGIHLFKAKALAKSLPRQKGYLLSGRLSAVNMLPNL
jgi:hypothetical protein